MSVKLNEYLALGATNLSAFLEGCDPGFDIEMHDDTTSGDVSRSNEYGLEQTSLTARFKHPYTDNGPDETIWGLRKTTFTVTYKPNSATTSASNPKFTWTATVESYDPGSGNVGEPIISTLVLAPAGGAALARATSD